MFSIQCVFITLFKLMLMISEATERCGSYAQSFLRDGIVMCLWHSGAAGFLAVEDPDSAFG